MCQASLWKPQQLNQGYKRKADSFEPWKCKHKRRFRHSLLFTVINTVKKLIIGKLRCEYYASVRNPAAKRPGLRRPRPALGISQIDKASDSSPPFHAAENHIWLETNICCLVLDVLLLRLCDSSSSSNLSALCVFFPSLHVDSYYGFSWPRTSHLHIVSPTNTTNTRRDTRTEVARAQQNRRFCVRSETHRCFALDAGSWMGRSGVRATSGLR